MGELVASIPEAALQRWMVRLAQKGDLVSSIGNLTAVKLEATELRARPLRHHESRRLGWLQNTLRACNTLYDVKLLADNRSVTPPGSPQLRPDLILCSPMGDYILVELKTAAAAERQTVQELLAYSAAMRAQAPFLGDIIYVIAAFQWDPLLYFAAQELIQHGQLVVPLRVAGGPDEFSLSLVMDLFTSPAPPYYDPWHALSPARIRLYGHQPGQRGHDHAGVLIRGMKAYATSEMRRLEQSGFVLSWLWRDQHSTEWAYNLMVLTVNQNWREVDPGSRCNNELPPDTLRDLKLKWANEEEKQSGSAPIAPDDFFAIAALEAQREEYFPESNLSWDILTRAANQVGLTSWRRTLEVDRDSDISVQRYLQAHSPQLIDGTESLSRVSLVPFGDAADYCCHNWRAHTVYDLMEMLDAFSKYKLNMRRQDAL